MNKILVNVVRNGGLRVAFVKANELCNIDVDQGKFERRKGNVYLAVVRSIEPSLEAAFVDYGCEKHGFLPLKEVAKSCHTQPETEISDPQKPLKIGQKLLVQVQKDERGTKGAALTTLISLAGSYLVLMPESPSAGGISKRIEGSERNELRDILEQLTIPDGMGLIIRTAGVGKTLEELQWDLDALVAHWKAITEAAAEQTEPHLIHQENNILTRAIRDYLRENVEAIIVDDESTFKKAEDYIRLTKPHFLDRLKLHTDSTPLFVTHRIARQIESIYQREIPLPSGGSISIDHTEALVSIDINSARSTRGSGIEETALNTNNEAVDEIARQLRLRDIGGLIVIDFIDMKTPQNQREVEAHLRKALRPDRARTQIGRISRFGLLEMSRQRLNSSFGESQQDTCPRCNGRGIIQGVETLALSLLRIIEEDTMDPQVTHLQVQVPVDIATFILNESRADLADIERRQKATVSIIPNPHLNSPQYKIKPSTSISTETSYQSLELPVPQEDPASVGRLDNYRNQPAIKPKPHANLSTIEKQKTETHFHRLKRFWHQLTSKRKVTTKEKNRTISSNRKHFEATRRRSTNNQQRRNRPQNAATSQKASLNHQRRRTISSKGPAA